jgi:outer membrane cobalamin receptor
MPAASNSSAASSCRTCTRRSLRWRSAAAATTGTATTARGTTRRPPRASWRADFNDIERIIPSGRLAALFHATPTTALRASVYQNFRVPTLNEQYRVFRVRSDVTMANESLRPEQLTGGELGVQQRGGPFEGRVTGYWNDVHDLIANVTLTGRLPDCPVGTTCRQRQNLDLARIRGIEAELDLRIAGD